MGDGSPTRTRRSTTIGRVTPAPAPAQPDRVGLVLGICAVWLGVVGVSISIAALVVRSTPMTRTPVPPGEDGIYDGVISGVIDGGAAIVMLGIMAIGAVAALAALGLAIAAAARRAPIALPIVAGLESCLAGGGLVLWFTMPPA